MKKVVKFFNNENWPIYLLITHALVSIVGLACSQNDWFCFWLCWLFYMPIIVFLVWLVVYFVKEAKKNGVVNTLDLWLETIKCTCIVFGCFFIVCAVFALVMNILCAFVN